ncbi:hypothetical protein QBC35DRAFT_505561 [Podospora australis]|uniref:Oxidase ustYa n=1 Tax=Podospora australis TaxID=1536484 RepID=A0AAN7AEV3_9PEZI|nr:hypothetical protein QBC35DRAFT_505561 [Podospora australis]
MMQPLPSPGYYHDQIQPTENGLDDDDYDEDNTIHHLRPETSSTTRLMATHHDDNDDEEDREKAGPTTAWSDASTVHHDSPAPQLSHHRRSRRRRKRSICTIFRSVLDTVLLLVILALLVERRWYRSVIIQRERDQQSSSPEFELAGDITGFAPRFPQKITTFSPSPSFLPPNASDFFTAPVRKAWLSIVPKGLGYVLVNSTSSYNNLPHPVKGYPSSTFTTSVTHQLHCLHTIVSVVSAYESGRKDMLPQDGTGVWHLGHCFDYLRQSIMCCGDTALEGQHTTFPPEFVGSDGWDAKHVCKDYDAIKEYLEGERVDDEVWI